jgi:hypothetical protein
MGYEKLKRKIEKRKYGTWKMKKEKLTNKRKFIWKIPVSHG